MKKKKKEPLCISISYQGTMPVTGEHPGICRDDCMRVALSKEGYPDILAYAVVNFPEIDGKKVLFIHEIFSCQSGKTGERMLLDAIMDIAEKRGYTCICANKGKTPERLLKRMGFQETDRNFLIKQVV